MFGAQLGKAGLASRSLNKAWHSSAPVVIYNNYLAINFEHYSKADSAKMESPLSAPTSSKGCTKLTDAAGPSLDHNGHNHI